MKLLIYFALLATLLSACTPNQIFTQQVKDIKSVDFQKNIDNKNVDLYTLTGKNNIGIKVTNWGARIVAVCVPDKEGNPVDVVCGYNTLDEYLNNSDSYFGCAIGRFGNRIKDGRFTLDGNDYQLAINNGTNALHGGPTGFHRRVWEVKTVAENKIEFEYVSADGEEGYPGELTINMSYELTDDDAIEIKYSARTTKPTVLNLTNHSYFNLSGEGSATINDHVVNIHANYITPVDSTLIPTGELMEVKGTPFDFLEERVIGDQLKKKHQQLDFGGGFDHNYVINQNEEINNTATVYSPVTGIKLDVLTDQPGVQFYSGNFLNGKLIGKSGKAYPYQGAFCFETQCFPDSPNQPQFPTTTLLPGQEYKHVCVYKFGVK